MSRGVNKVILVGNLGADPDYRVIASGTPVCKLNVATTEKFKDRSGEWQDKTEWHRVTLWRALADNANKYLKKGDQVYLEGRLQTSSWEKDGVTRYTTEVVANEMVFLGGNRAGGGGYQRDSGPAGQDRQNGSQGGNYEPDVPEDEDDDLPF